MGNSSNTDPIRQAKGVPSAPTPTLETNKQIFLIKLACFDPYLIFIHYSLGNYMTYCSKTSGESVRLKIPMKQSVLNKCNYFLL